jgi:emfourin
VKIKLERSGGIAGMSFSNELDSNSLPPSMKNVIKQLLDKKQSSSLRAAKPDGAADCFIYKIIIQEGKKSRVIEFNELNMHSELKKLVRYLQKTPNEIQ